MLNRIFRGHDFALLVADADCGGSADGMIEVMIIRRLRTAAVVIAKSDI